MRREAGSENQRAAGFGVQAFGYQAIDKLRLVQSQSADHVHQLKNNTPIMRCLTGTR
jgi:hypothetical protein